MAHNKYQSAKAVRAETHDIVPDCSCFLINWEDIKDHQTPNLDVFTSAAIPHKSMDFCRTLDLSFSPQTGTTTLHLPVTSMPAHSDVQAYFMTKLGNVL
jgi:hypothetical protein